MGYPSASDYKPHHPRRVYVEERIDALEARLARLEERLNWLADSRQEALE